LSKREGFFEVSSKRKGLRRGERVFGQSPGGGGGGGGGGVRLKGEKSTRTKKSR